MEDDDFIKSSEFKSFLYKIKQNELTLSLMPGEDPEKNHELVEKLLAYDPESETMTPAEARELVHISGMILIPNWDIEKAFVLDQMRIQDKAVSYEATGSEGFKRGSGFTVYTITLVVWSIAPDTKKPKMMDIQ